MLRFFIFAVTPSIYLAHSSVQLLSPFWLFVTPWTAAHQASLFLIISRNLPKFMSIASVMSSSHLILWHPLLLLPSTFPASRTFPMSCLFTSGNQNTRVSVSASVYTKSLLKKTKKLSVKQLNSLKDILVQIFFSQIYRFRKKKKSTWCLSTNVHFVLYCLALLPLIEHSIILYWLIDEKINKYVFLSIFLEYLLTV